MFPNTHQGMYIKKSESSGILNKHRGIKPIIHFMLSGKTTNPPTRVGGLVVLPLNIKCIIGLIPLCLFSIPDDSLFFIYIP